jgi:hypothetical protein
LELDGKGNIILLAQRIMEDQEKARAACQTSIKNPEGEAEESGTDAPPSKGPGGSPRDEEPQGQQGSTKR